MRRRHYPPALNRVPAHVTLFHALPGEAETQAAEALGALGQEGFTVEITSVRSLGRGVAFTIASEGLVSRRRAIASCFAGRLTAQDNAPFRPHITVQNKVTPGEARALLAELSASFVPETAAAGALHLWRYRGGPWEPVLTMPFPGCDAGRTMSQAESLD